MKPSPALTLLRQQLMTKVVTIALWILAWSLLGILFVTVFNDLSKSASDSAKVFQSLPPAILKSFNIADNYLTVVEKFLSGQFLSIYLLSGSIFALNLGISAIGGKLKDATIMNLLTKPLSRPAIFMTQALANCLTLLLANAGVWTVLYGIFSGFSRQAHVSGTYFLSGMLGTDLVLLTVTLLGGVLGLATQRASYVGSAVIVVSYFLNGLGGLGGIPAWIQRLSLFYYFNTVQLREAYTLDLHRAVILAAVGALLLAAGTVWFRRKDIHL